MNNWDWNILVTSREFAELALSEYPSWDKSKDGNPPFVRLKVVSGVTKSSRDIATEWDDTGRGRFYYRDWTASGIPIVDEGEKYTSGFWFQFEEDAIKFHSLYGGELIK